MADFLRTITQRDYITKKDGGRWRGGSWKEGVWQGDFWQASYKYNTLCVLSCEHKVILEGHTDCSETICWKCEAPHVEKRRRRSAHLKRSYGITIEQFDAMLDGQGGACAVCRSVDPKGYRGVFMVDHCHTTGNVRGLLCAACNSGIGSLGDTSHGVRRALAYLESSEQ